VIAEAIDTVITIGWALLAWIILTAVFATLALYTLVVTAWTVCRAVWRAGRAAWRAVRGRHAPDSRPQPVPCGSRDANTPQRATQARSVPSWAREPHDYEDAA
jgi:hypothetical protein